MGLSLLLDISASLDPGRPLIGPRSDGRSAAVMQELAAGGAAVLHARGARTVAWVGVNAPAFPVTLFACATAGVPLAPLNYRLAAGQLGALIDRLDAPLIVADADYADIVAGPGRDVLTTPQWLALCDTAAQEQATLAPATYPGADDDEAPAVLLFTSGTTAEPKCVILSHANLQAYVLGTVEPGSAQVADAALVSVPPYHIAGVGTVLTNVFAGRRLLYLTNFTPAGWLDLLRSEGVTFAMVVPTMLSRIVAELGDEPAGLPELRTLAYGGARMPLPVLERALTLLPHVDFVNAYGLTETSSTVAVLGPSEHREAMASTDPAVRARLASAGRLIAGVEGEIRDDAGRAVSPGGTGELWLRGEQISGEYDGQGSVLDADGWFPTRDVARFDADGFLFLGGRSDDVIIRGGENIAPAEIEDVLLAHPCVADVAVVGLPDDDWGEATAAVVVLTTPAGADADELRDWVRGRLRSSRTPDHVFFLGELPRTDTGKLVRRHLVNDLEKMRLAR